MTPRVLGERYRLDAVIGEGGMGVVYAAFDLTIQRTVAVKLLRRDAAASADDARRLLLEVRSTGRVKSAHTVTLFDVGQTDEGDPFLVMELVAGESLAETLKRERVLPLTRAVAIAVQVCAALDAAHAVGIVHRDVKPPNIMLSPRRESEQPHDHVTVLDFGIAKHLAQPTAVTEPGALVGTLEYMAPEQIAGEALDGRADQYALAATLIRMISGESLFPGAGVASIVHHHLLKVPSPLCDRVPSAPRALDAALRRALEKKPDARYPDIRAFATALRAAAGLTETSTDAETPQTRRPEVASRRPLVRTQEMELVIPGDAAGLEVDAPAVLLVRPAPAPLVHAPRRTGRTCLRTLQRNDEP